MSRLELRNLLIYCGIAVVLIVATALAAALATGTLPGFRVGEPFAVASPILAAMLAVLVPILTTALAASRPRIGSAQIAADVDAEVAAGTSRAGLTVRRKTSNAKLTLAQEQQAVDAVRAAMTAETKGSSQFPVGVSEADQRPLTPRAPSNYRPIPSQGPSDAPLVTQDPHWLPPEQRP